MKQMLRASSRWILVAILALWVAGLFLVSGSAWLAPFVSGDFETLSEGLLVARAGERPGRARLGRVELREGAARALEIEAEAGEEVHRFRDPEPGLNASASFRYASSALVEVSLSLAL